MAADPYRGKILAILESGTVSVSGHAAVGGRDALRLVSADSGTTIFVDPQTYRPIEWRTTTPEGTDATSFGTYEELPRSEANDARLSLRAEHPSARIDASAAGYQAALDRLFAEH